MTWQDKLKQVGKGIWTDVKDIRAYYERGEIASLEDDSGLRPIDADSVARKSLSANDIVHYYSIRIRAKDKQNPRRIVETWVTGYQLKKILMLSPYPTRRAAQMNHDKYQVILAYLMKAGLVARKQNGYRWVKDYSSVVNRAEWLVDTLKNKGEMRNKVEGRWHIL